jgi:hypothetical protein
LTCNRKYSSPPPDDLFLKAKAFQSHAFTLGFTGRIKESKEYFKISKEIASTLGDALFCYYSDLGIIDIDFHDYSFDRLNPSNNVKLLKDIEKVIAKATQEILEEDAKCLIISLLNFRKAILLWLQKDLPNAKTAFETTWRFSETYFKVWALFGIVYCSLNDSREHKKWASELSKSLKLPAWHKNAMKYWPVALLLGRTWDLLGQTDKSQGFYRKILLNVRLRYAEQKVASTDYATFITNYFYPIYQETIKHNLEVGRKYQITLNRAEMFRARFLSEGYKRHHVKQKVDQLLTSNVRIDKIGADLSERFNNDISVLYCFDLKGSGRLLLSKDLVNDYKQINISSNDYQFLNSFSSKHIVKAEEIDELSNIFQVLTHEIKTTHLLIIPHGVFGQIPFQALKKNGEPIIKSAIVNYWPSLQMAVLGEKIKQVAASRIIFLGTKNDPDSIREIEQLSKRCKNNIILYDPDEKLFAKTLNNCDGVVHIVTHGHIKRTKQDITVIQFDGKQIELSLFVKDIEILPQLFLLNVCYGGYTRYSDVDFIQGLPVAFFQKGSESLIVSNRTIEKDISMSFSQRFYKCLFNGYTVGEAYQKAIVEADDIDKMLVNAPYLMGNSMLSVNTQ